MKIKIAQVVKLVDTLPWGGSDLMVVQVQILFWAHFYWILLSFFLSIYLFTFYPFYFILLLSYVFGDDAVELWLKIHNSTFGISYRIKATLQVLFDAF